MIDTTPIKLSIVHEPSLHNSQKHCCEVSVPLPQSMVFKLEQLSVSTDTNDKGEEPHEIDALCQIVAYWPDNSLKWIKLTYQYVKQPQLYLNFKYKYYIIVKNCN